MAYSEERVAPPRSLPELAGWFAQGVRSEIAALEKKGSEQQYELLSGKLLDVVGEAAAIYEFIVADGTRIPEDSNGFLKAGKEDLRASIISQQANRLQLEVDTGPSPPKSIPRAVLLIDDTSLLRRLAEALEKITSEPPPPSVLASHVFHPDKASTGTVSLTGDDGFDTLDDEQRSTLERACASTVTYVWGPPGTGKTFAIARLVATLLERGERVLVTSHTHAAVDQALYATVTPEGVPPGPLANDPLVEEGKIVRLGRTSDRKIPNSVKLEGIVDRLATKLRLEIIELEDAARPLQQELSFVRSDLSEWKKLAAIEEKAKTAHEDVRRKRANVADTLDALRRSEAEVRSYQQDLERAQKAWFLRATRVERAHRALRDLSKSHERLRRSFQEISIACDDAEAVLVSVEEALKEQAARCSDLRPEGELRARRDALDAELRRLQQKRHAIEEEISSLQQRVIDQARSLFCTLTKNYTARELEGQTFDAVIVDEISMALPPLLFLAAGRARRRVVLVGDPYQLPPIVRSDSELSDERLRTDAFRLSDIVRDSRPVEGHPALTQFRWQRRMLPEIADLARHLVYGPRNLLDHADVLRRPLPEWVKVVSLEPLLIIDTADLNCWCGKQPGSLSRFNFYTATLCVELAAVAAAEIPEPKGEEPPPIGIVTPYAAQRRLLSRLVEELGLSPWVAAGTVHTFQGGQADLIIFDSVLDEPYYSARLCNPREAEDVKRDLNVAVTRAKHAFVFVGSSEWLNRHAKQTSGLGRLWAQLRDRAPLEPAEDYIGAGFLDRILLAGRIEQGPDADTTDQHETGWVLPLAEQEPAHEILDETSFFNRFSVDLGSCQSSVFALTPYFGEYRWPRVEPLITAALARGVEVTLVTPPTEEAENPRYVRSTIENLRRRGAIVISASGLHGKDIVIDERIHYTGSLNWASHRGRSEIMHRTNSPRIAKLVLEYMQARYIRGAAVHSDGQPRICPECGGSTHVVNQLRQHSPWDFQALKVGCASYKATGCSYLRNIDERPPFLEIPRCQVDGRTRYRRVKRGRGEVWQCPKHPKESVDVKVVVARCGPHAAAFWSF